MLFAFAAIAEDDLLAPETQPAAAIDPAAEPIMEAPSEPAPIDALAPVGSTQNIAETLPQQQEPQVEPAITLDAPQDQDAMVADEVVFTPSYLPFDGIDSVTLNSNLRSLFYSQEQLDVFNDSVRRAKLSTDGGQGLVSKLVEKAESIAAGEEEKKKEPEKVAIVFALKSILYPDDGNWTIWLNDKKIRKEEGESDGLKVLSVNSNSATFIYRGLDLAVYAEELKSRLSPIEGDANEGEYYWDYQSSDGNIKFASSQKIIKFTLRPLQTFSVESSEVAWGSGEMLPLVEQDISATGEAGTNYGSKPDPLEILKPANDASGAGSGFTGIDAAQLEALKKQESPSREALLKMITDNPKYKEFVRREPKLKPLMDDYNSKIVDWIMASSEKAKEIKIQYDGEIVTAATDEKKNEIREKYEGINSAHAKEASEKLKVILIGTVKEIVKYKATGLAPIMQSTPADAEAEGSIKDLQPDENPGVEEGY